MAKLVSKIYGDALFETAVEEDRVDDFFEETEGIRRVLEENEELPADESSTGCKRRKNAAHREYLQRKGVR